MIPNQENSESLQFPICTLLDDGSLVLVRPLNVDDKPLLEIGMAQLSDEDRYFRFLQPMPHLPEKMLRSFTEIDHINHEAVGALDAGDEIGAPAGVARYVRTKRESNEAEIAITIVDRYKGSGLAVLLLELLMDIARQNQIDWFEAVVSADNERMLGFLRKFSPANQIIEDDVIRVRLSTNSKLKHSVEQDSILPPNWMSK